jgi:hypothetical protein
MPGKPKFKPSIRVIEQDGGFVVEINLWQGDSGSFVSRGNLNYRSRANANAVRVQKFIFGSEYENLDVKLLHQKK